MSFCIAAYVQGFAQVGNSTSCLPEPSAECRIKKLIICSFADRLRSARTADDSSTNAPVYSVCPTCAKPRVGCRWLCQNGFSQFDWILCKVKLISLVNNNWTNFVESRGPKTCDLITLIVLSLSCIILTLKLLSIIQYLFSAVCLDADDLAIIQFGLYAYSVTVIGTISIPEFEHDSSE